MTDTKGQSPEAAAGLASRTARKIFALGLALALFLMVIRLRMIKMGWEVLWSPWHMERTLGASFFDLIFAESLTAAFLLGCIALRRRPRGLRWCSRMFHVAVIVTLLAGLVNLEATGLLGTPVNYQWLYYSDFLTSFDANQAVADTISTKLILTILACLIGLFVVAWAIERGLGLVLVGRRTATTAGVVAAVASYVYFSISAPYMLGRSDYLKFANPVCLFVASTLAAEDESLASMDTPFGDDDFQTAAQRGDTKASAGRPGIRNVVLFVFESVPASYCETYGGKDPVTPRLKQARPQALQFSRIYSHAPSTNKAIVSITCSIYPWVSYKSISREHPHLDVPSVASALKPHGYRTSMYHAADLSFQSMGDFLEGRGFDVIVDRRTMPKVAGDFDSDDEKAAGAFVDWIGQDAGKPFFGMFWTRATHMPYYSRGKLSYGKRDREHIRYLNALQDGDAALGVVLDGLATRGLSDSTLVVVIGDHGEAFGQHGQRGHGVKIYEENVHIPCLLINPKLFRGGESDVVGGTIDVGPTILDVLGKPLPGVWQGRSLLAQDRPPRTYFFAPWSEQWFGFRDDDQKFLYNGLQKEWEHYDLAEDPLELRNLVADTDASRQAIETAQQRLAAWVQAQVQFLRVRKAATK